VLGLYSLAGATAGAALALRKAGASGAAAVALWLATTAALAHSFIAAVVTPSLLLSAGLRSLGCAPSGSKTPAGAPARVAELEADNEELRAAANASAIAAAVATRERNDAEAAAARKDVLLQQLLALNEAAAAQLQVLAAEQPALAACAASERAACKEGLARANSQVVALNQAAQAAHTELQHAAAGAKAAESDAAALWAKREAVLEEMLSLQAQVCAQLQEERKSGEPRSSDLEAEMDALKVKVEELEAQAAVRGGAGQQAGRAQGVAASQSAPLGEAAELRLQALADENSTLHADLVSERRSIKYLTAARSAAELQAQQVRQEATRLAAVCAGLQEQSSHEREDLAKVAKAAAALETSAGSAEATDATAAALRRRWPELAGELLERCRLSVARLRASTEERVALEAAIAAEHKSSKALANRCSAAEGTCAGMTTRVERLNRDIHQLRAITQGAEGELEKLQAEKDCLAGMVQQLEAMVRSGAAELAAAEDDRAGLEAQLASALEQLEAARRRTLGLEVAVETEAEGHRTCAQRLEGAAAECRLLGDAQAAASEEMADLLTVLQSLDAELRDVMDGGAAGGDHRGQRPSDPTGQHLDPSEEAGSNVAATLQHRYTELHAAANQLRSLPGAGNVLSCLPDSAEGIIGDGREDEDEDDADRSFSADRSEAIAQVTASFQVATYLLGNVTAKARTLVNVARSLRGPPAGVQSWTPGRDEQPGPSCHPLADAVAAQALSHSTPSEGSRSPVSVPGRESCWSALKLSPPHSTAGPSCVCGYAQVARWCLLCNS